MRTHVPRFSLTTQKRVYDLVAETPAQAALWKVWIATQLRLCCDCAVTVL